MATINDPVITNNTITFGNQNTPTTYYGGDPSSHQFDPTTNHWVDYRDNTSFGPKYHYNTHTLQHSYEEILRKRILEESHAKKISMVIQEFFDDE